MDGIETRFADGNLTPVVRIGATVRRATGPWTSSVHSLLRYLESVGFDGAPRVLGTDDQDREVLGYIEGATGPADLSGIESDEILVATAKLIRRYHDAVAGFRPPPGAIWRYGVGAPRRTEVICHNDIAPWNTVFTGRRPIALIDWDLAAPGPRDWDVAHALWRFVPLSADERFGSPDERARRMVLFADTYGLSKSARILDVIEHRQRVLFDTVRAWAADGVPGFVELLRDGHGDGVLHDLGYLRRHRSVLVQGLEARCR